MDITRTDTVGEDFARVGDKLSAYTIQKGAPAYNPLSTTFTAASDAGEILGEAVITENWGEVEINLLHVEEDQRGNGIGRKLVSAIEDYARASDAKVITLSSPTWQAGTRVGETGFYETCGYEVMDRIPVKSDIHGNDHQKVLYKKVLGPQPE
jgi:GNAT superfamily N-acetyltransferase